MVNVVSEDFFLTDTLNLALYLIHLRFNFFYFTILFVISAL